MDTLGKIFQTLVERACNLSQEILDGQGARI